MIDLRKQGLPTTIEVDGVEYKLNTDFRVWIEFERSLREDGIGLYIVFDGDIPDGDGWVKQALEFAECRNSTPTGSATCKDIPYDLVQDGAYIVAGFMQAYGIDLTSIDYMHWHLFKALFDGLPEETKMSKIIGYRTWEKSSEKYDNRMRKIKRAWKLPDPKHEKELEEARKIAEMMYTEVNDE